MSVKIIGTQSELGAGVRGAGLGIEALKKVALDIGSDLFTQYPLTEVADFNARLFEGTSYPFAKFIDSILLMERRICGTVFEAFQESHTPLLMTGDHSSAYGVMAGIKKAYPDKRLGVIWIDAHADLHSPFTTPSGNMHGMPLAMACQIHNEECGINQLDETTLDYWRRVQRVGTSLPKIQLTDVVYIAVRDIDASEAVLMEKYGVHSFTVKQIRREGAKVCAQRALGVLQYCDLIYVSFDVDSISAGFSMGTGTPVFKGLTLLEAQSLNRELAKSSKLCAWEITEINPLNDARNKMANGVFSIVENVAQLIGKRYVT